MKNLIATVGIGACLVLPYGGLVFAGQPGLDCADLIAAKEGNFPGHASSSPGSPFHEAGALSPSDPGGKGGQVYANGTDNPPGNNPNHPSSANLGNAVSQYDVACSHQQVP